MFMLNVEPSKLEMPSIERVLTDDGVSTFLALPQDRRDCVSLMFRRSAIASYVSYVASQRAPVELSSIAAALGGVLSGHAVSALESATLRQESGALLGFLGWLSGGWYRFRQSEAEHASSSGFALDPDASAVGFDDSLGDA